MKEFIKDIKKIETIVKKDAATIIGTEAVNHFTENFEKQGFDGEPWKDVKRRNPKSTRYGHRHGANTDLPANPPRRKGAKGKYKRRKADSITHYSPTATKTRILSSEGRAELENSLYFKAGTNKVTIKSDKEYAKVHNEGGTIKVYGKHTAKVPARPFIGPSKELNEKIKRALDGKLKIKS
ncbi:MAG: phage virion morphogenesis protein [Ekhidna sp.]|nr:phage virion morphogenesis protein [Ekhidna sp.]